MPLGSAQVHHPSLSQWLRHARLAKSDVPTRLVPTRLRRYTDFPHDRRSQAYARRYTPRFATLAPGVRSQTLVVPSATALRAATSATSTTWFPEILSPECQMPRNHRLACPLRGAMLLRISSILARRERSPPSLRGGSFLACLYAPSDERRSLAAGSRLCLEFLAPARNSEKTVSQPRHEVARSSLAHVSSSGLLRDSWSRSLAPRNHRLACPTRGAKVRSPRPPATPSLR